MVTPSPRQANTSTPSPTTETDTSTAIVTPLGEQIEFLIKVHHITNLLKSPCQTDHVAHIDGIYPNGNKTLLQLY